VCLRVHRFPGCRLAKLDKVRDCAELSFGPNVGDVATDLRSSRRCPRAWISGLAISPAGPIAHGERMRLALLKSDDIDVEVRVGRES
jgi:hypothetical protein